MGVDGDALQLLRLVPLHLRQTADLLQQANEKVVFIRARASISFRGDYIYEADVLIDVSEAFYFEDEALPASSGRIQFKSLIIHELGHVLGLAHVEEGGTNSVMFPKLQFGQLRPTLTPLVNASGEKQLNAQGQEVLGLQLPEIDRDSLACEYQ